MYGLLTGEGSVARFAEGSGRGEVVKVVLRAYGEIISGLPAALRKRRRIWAGRRIAKKEYRKLLEGFRISAGELILRD